MLLDGQRENLITITMDTLALTAMATSTQKQLQFMMPNSDLRLISNP